MVQEAIIALRINGDTMNKILQLGKHEGEVDIRDMTLGELWNNYYVRNLPVPARGRKPATTTSAILPADTFYRLFHFVDGRQPRRKFALVEKNPDA